MKCPRCGEELQKRTVGSVEIDECQGCKGIWFDEDELRKIKDETDADLNWMDFELWKHHDRFHVAQHPIKCPKCDVEMAAINYDKTDVEIDCCAKCRGVWLDSGEFRKVIDALTEELLTKSPKEYIRASLEEAKEVVTGPENFISEWKDFMNVIRMLEYRILTENPHVSQALAKIQSSIPIR
jgi:Zn-finger nucleic acid-binding protein